MTSPQLLQLWKHVLLIEVLQKLQLCVPGIGTPDGYDHTLLQGPDGEEAGGLLRNMELTLHLIPIIVSLLEVVGAIFHLI